jgi:hypothetical protein
MFFYLMCLYDNFQMGHLGILKFSLQTLTTSPQICAFQTIFKLGHFLWMLISILRLSLFKWECFRFVQILTILKTFFLLHFEIAQSSRFVNLQNQDQKNALCEFSIVPMDLCIFPHWLFWLWNGLVDLSPLKVPYHHHDIIQTCKLGSLGCKITLASFIWLVGFRILYVQRSKNKTFLSYSFAIWKALCLPTYWMTNPNPLYWGFNVNATCYKLC